MKNIKKILLSKQQLKMQRKIDDQIHLIKTVTLFGSI